MVTLADGFNILKSKIDNFRFSSDKYSPLWQLVPVLVEVDSCCDKTQRSMKPYGAGKQKRMYLAHLNIQYVNLLLFSPNRWLLYQFFLARHFFHPQDSQARIQAQHRVLAFRRTPGPGVDDEDKTSLNQTPFMIDDERHFHLKYKADQKHKAHCTSKKKVYERQGPT